MLLNKVKTPSDHRAAIRGVMGGKTFSKTDKVTRNYSKVGSRQTKMFQGHFGCLNLLKFRFPALITRRSQVRVLSPQPLKNPVFSMDTGFFLCPVLFHVLGNLLEKFNFSSTRFQNQAFLRNTFASISAFRLSAPSMI